MNAEYSGLAPSKPSKLLDRYLADACCSRFYANEIISSKGLNSSILSWFYVLVKRASSAKKCSRPATNGRLPPIAIASI